MPGKKPARKWWVNSLLLWSSPPWRLFCANRRQRVSLKLFFKETFKCTINEDGTSVRIVLKDRSKWYDFFFQSYCDHEEKNHFISLNKTKSIFLYRKHFDYYTKLYKLELTLGIIYYFQRKYLYSTHFFFFGKVLVSNVNGIWT